VPAACQGDTAGSNPRPCLVRNNPVCVAASSPPCFFQAMFEIITSEYSYLHSLGVLVSHFMRSGELRGTMTQTEHHHLFSNISDVLAASTRQAGLGPGRPQGGALELCSFGVVEGTEMSRLSPISPAPRAAARSPAVALCCYVPEIV